MREEKDKLDQNKVSEFWTRIYKMADKELGTDDEGDSLVQITVVDRTRCEPLHFMPVPYEHEAKSDEELDRILELRVSNLKVATEALQRDLQKRRYRRERQKDEKKK